MTGPSPGRFVWTSGDLEFVDAPVKLSQQLDDEVVTLSGQLLDLVRHVRTPAGEAFFHLPIGSPIGGGKEKSEFQKRLGMCYKLAGDRAMSNPDVAQLVHGSIQGFGHPRIGHAWNVNKDGSIWEPATNTSYPPYAFKAIFNPETEASYTPHEMNVKIADSGTYGPWHDESSPKVFSNSVDENTENGVLRHSRQRLHDRIVAQALAGHATQTHPVATFLGGGPASGKSSVMNKTGEDSVNIAADDVKPLLSGYDEHGAVYVHDESSDIADAMMHRSVAKKYNFTLDGTGNSSYAKMVGRVADAHKAGYIARAKYVTVDTNEAVRRAKLREAKTGRGVPESIIREKHAAVSNIFKQAVDNNLFDSVELWDNNGDEPKLIGSKPLGGSFAVHDSAAYQRFLAKGQEVA